MLEEEFKYFKDNQEDLFLKYPNKYLVIKGNEVKCSTESFELALKTAKESGLKVGEFLIQLCTKGTEAYTQTFHSRVIFA